MTILGVYCFALKDLNLQKELEAGGWKEMKADLTIGCVGFVKGMELALGRIIESLEMDS